jgi:hypothetical protein
MVIKMIIRQINTNNKQKTISLPAFAAALRIFSLSSPYLRDPYNIRRKEMVKTAMLNHTYWVTVLFTFKIDFIRLEEESVTVI